MSLTTTKSRLEDLLEMFEFLTLLHPDYDATECVYCGETATEADHLLPKPYTGEALRSVVPTVPSCRECNCTLGDRFLPDVADRREWLHKRYRTKYKKRLKTVMLGELDLAELGPQLRAALVAQMDEHERLMRRLAWPPTSDYDDQAWRYAWEQPIS